MKQEFNHNRPLEDFQESLKIIKEHGFNPIGVSQIYFEDTFIFETEQEATKAYETLELIEEPKVLAFWYGKENFLQEVDEYETFDNSSKVLIYWL